ncbi:hypothetical protein AB0I30_19000 [Nocardia tengchongensis]|uniref:hypothetical protein n=1 Tax=Nocardia tengchongensis TaxID=2055889 RepID=UPI0033F9D3A1
MIQFIVLGLNIVLGNVPDVVPLAEHDSPTEPVSRRRSSVLLIQEQEAIAEGAGVEFRPLPYIRGPLGDWLDADPSRSRAMWCASGLPLTWAADEKRYSPTGLIKKMYMLAGVPAPESIPGPDYWYVLGSGSLYEIANRIRNGDFDLLH